MADKPKTVDKAETLGAKTVCQNNDDGEHPPVLTRSQRNEDKEKGESIVTILFANEHGCHSVTETTTQSTGRGHFTQQLSQVQMISCQ